MARSTRLTDEVYYSGWDADSDVSPEELNGLDLGYYQRTNLQDIISNFIVMYIGEDKVLTRVRRYEVAAVAQRAIQEFSYDIFHSEKTLELEVSPSLSIALPTDFVNYVKVFFTDQQGTDHFLYRSLRTVPKRTVVQDSQYDFVYDDTGTKAVGEKAISLRRFQDPSNDINNITRDYYYGYAIGLYDDYGYFYRYYGQRYGADPRELNTNREFVIDLYDGVIYLDSSFQAGDIVSLQYVSDGLGNNGDLSQVFVPKLAEDAIYSNILYNLCKIRPSAVQLAPLYQKEARAKMRNAKIRLSDYRVEEMTRAFRYKSKWIKH